MNDLQKHLRERDALFREATLAAAKRFMPEPPGGYAAPDVPLAALHKARLQWLDATDAMLAESQAWLKAHGYLDSWRGAPPMTPDRRDIERLRHGRAPLKGKR